MSSSPLVWLDSNSNDPFPPVEQSFDDGLLAAGGDLSTQRLINAYQQGIFPWFNQGDPILWWSPDPRMVLLTDQVKLSRSLRKTLNKSMFRVSFDQAFRQVMTACSEPRVKANGEVETGTWIHPDMISAYSELHQQGLAHSVECWQGEQLVGGLYGVAIGRMFFGESMFSRVTDSSKVALVMLCQQLQRWQMPLIDCQVYSKHLASLGAIEIKRRDFIAQMQPLCQQQSVNDWQLAQDMA